MIVDDDETFRRTLGETLARAGYAVSAAENGSDALRLHQQETFDLIITDLIMPEKDGFETIIELRRRQPDLKIIAISGGGRVDADDYLPIAQHLGAARALEKPFTSDEIHEAVASLLT
jgi:CheY-like chemotaxis protein